MGEQVVGLKSFFKTYFDFHYGIGFIIGMAIFIGYLWMISKQRIKRGWKISGVEIFDGLALSGYMVFLIGCTLLSRSPGGTQNLQLSLFWSHREVFLRHDREIAKQIVFNILAFLPWGILVPKCFYGMRKFSRLISSAVVASALIEILQLGLRCGLCELDDVLHNGIGAAIGYGIWWGCHKWTICR